MIIHPAIKLRHLRAFADIAQEGSLSAVARAQGITQPALSRTLAELEVLLATPLFRRENRRLVLTQQGALFRRHVHQSLQSLEAGAAALRPGNSAGLIRAGILPTAATRLFPRVALRLRETTPELLLQIETGPHTYLVRLLRDSQIDLMIGRMPDAAEMAGLAFQHLYEDRVVLVARAGHPLADQPPERLLRQVPVILPPQTAIIRRPVDDYLVSLNLIGLRPAFETAALAIGRGIVTESDAVWFISQGVVEPEIERGELVTVPTGAGYLSGAVGLTHRQSGRPVPGLEMLLQLALDEARHHG